VNCKFEGCGNKSEKSGLCEIHYWRDRWLDNRDPSNLGIVLFAKMIIPEWVRNETPTFHIEMYRAFLAMYNPKHRDKYDRLLGVIAFRGAAKTTFSKICLLYTCCFGLEKLVIYSSETNSFAVQDVFEVRRELGTNPYIRRYFGIISSRAVKGSDGEWSRDAFLTSTKVYVLARGVGQQVRSALRNSYRPTLAIINDMYSKNSVKTEYTRAEYAKWFFNDLFNAVDDIEGKVFFNGTVLHEDTVPVTIEANPDWKILKYPIMDLDDFHRVLSECIISDRGVKLPSEERIIELAKTCKLAWPERLDLRYILRKFREAYQSMQLAGFYQEYFHITTPPGEKPFGNVVRVRMQYFYSRNSNWIKVFHDEDSPTILNVNIFGGIDPAISTQQNSKFSVIAVVAMDSYRRVYVLAYSRGRYGARDEYLPGSRPQNGDMVTADKSRLKRVGMVDEEIRLAKQYHFTSATVETIQLQKAIYDEINRIKVINNAPHNVIPVNPTENKIERDSDTLGPYFQSQAFFINTGMSDLELELGQFPRGATVDIIDAIQMAVMNARPPSEMNFQKEFSTLRKQDEYETEFVVL